VDCHSAGIATRETPSIGEGGAVRGSFDMSCALCTKMKPSCPVLS
jgi:hypothetical protein